jgi:predicted secreted Zn-dependent protease
MRAILLSAVVASGDTAATLYNSMLRRGPHVNGAKAYAATSAESSQRGKLLPGRSCRVKDYRFTIAFTIKLPRLKEGASLPPPVRGRWQQFSAFLKKHEETHRSIWLACARDLETRVNALRADSCEEVDATAGRMWEDIQKSCTKKHDAFDAAEQRRLLSHPFVKLVRARSGKKRAAAAAPPAIHKKKRAAAVN